MLTITDLAPSCCHPTMAGPFTSDQLDWLEARYRATGDTQNFDGTGDPASGVTGGGSSTPPDTSSSTTGEHRI